LNTLKTMRRDAIEIFNAGISAVKPDQAILNHCRLDNNHLIVGPNQYDLNRCDHIYVIGAGKATAIMAKTIEQLLGNRIDQGCIIVKYDHTVKLDRIRIHQAGHPLPDENGVAGAKEILKLARKAGSTDLIICLISGGGSALMPLPAKGISLTDKQTATDILLHCGAPIYAINTLRKHLSALKGGQLARIAAPAQMLTLILSDVIGDDLEVIASGPTAPDPTSFADCLKIINLYGLINKMPSNIIDHIKLGLVSQQLETPKPENSFFKNVRNIIIASNREAIHGAQSHAKDLGYNSLILSSMIEGETREVARVHLAIAKEIIQSANPIPPPACLISGGETTVTIKGSGKGGRNQEFALAAATDLGTKGQIVVLSGGTDGTDGPTDAAGAISDTATLLRANAEKMDPNVFLKNNDSYNFFLKLNDLLITGPTHTNVMDLRIILVRES
jgi:glycerate 2-kinase